MSSIDLNDLAKRESERVEWKENVADIDSVARTVVAFANDYANLGGGYIICGVKETKDEFGFQKMLRTGMTSSRCKEVENKLLAVLRDNVTPPITPLTEEIPVDAEHRILVFIVPASPTVHTLKSCPGENGVCYYRSGRDTRVAKNGILMELLTRKNAIEPWDRRANSTASLDDIDILALRDILQEMGVWKESTPLEDYLSDTERIYALTPPFTVSEPMTRRLCPRNFVLLLFGKSPPKFFPGAYTIFSVYRGTDRSEPNAEKHEIIGNIVYQARRCIELLNAESYTVFDKQSETPNQRKYPQRALQEAVVNAIVHRDYENDQPTRITVFGDRIEFNSPGSLPRTIDKEKFVSGKAPPHWRNQSIAFFFNKLQLAQAEGQGIPTILRTMQEEGCPKPIFELETEKVICVLPAHPRHMLMKRFQSIEQDIILGNYESAATELSEILETDSYNFRAIDLFCETSGLLGTPKLILDFINAKRIDLKTINSSTLLVIADTVSQIHPKDKRTREIIQKILSIASESAVEEKQFERIVINLRKIEKAEKVIEYIETIFSRLPRMRNNLILLENSARAKMDLAKKCIETGKNTRNFNFERRRKAWLAAKGFLDDAERELHNAMENATNYFNKDYIQRDLEFLHRLKKTVNNGLQKKSRHRD